MSAIDTIKTIIKTGQLSTGDYVLIDAILELESRIAALEPKGKSEDELVRKYAKQLIDRHGMPGEPREWELRDILRSMLREGREGR